ncbi:MAG: DUF2380 domain-containing protein [Methylophaga sp.]|nr:DUF2380 domain-containing protein [Methylophaga sp.]
MKNFMKILIALSLIACGNAIAATKIGVLDMQLLNLTMKMSDPQKNAEMAAEDLENVELTECLLRKGFEAREQFTLVEIDSEVQAEANKGVGYLFDRPEAAAELGEKFDADYVVVGRYHKPTYLFSYIILRVVDVHSGKMIEEIKTEVKGRAQETIPTNIGNVMVKFDILLADN